MNLADMADAFLQAIVEHPADDTPRLVYADWLDDQGDTDRAEFIRVQCELAKLAEHDPRRSMLERRSQELLDKHAREWLKPLPEWAVRAPVWRRGFVVEVWAKGEDFLRGAGELLRLCPLATTLHLSHNGIGAEGAVALAGSPHLANLITLLLLYNQIGDEGAVALASSPHLANLTTLNLDGNGIEGEGTEALRQRFGAGVRW
jgi:uncharacterized protein (TIGR02996 family)